jgi:hypothetical protein
MAVDYLSDVATALLNGALAGLALATTGHAPPDEAYVSHGPPPWDRACDDGMLTVHLEALTHQPDPGDNLRQSCQIVPRPVWVVTVLRCVPGLSDGNDPLPATSDLDDAHGDLLVDLWALLTEVYDRIENNTLIPGTDDPCDFTVGDVTPLGPDGRVAGWEIRVHHVANDQGPTGS